MTEPTQGKKIVVTKDGPYMVSGEVPIAIQIITPNREGSSWEWKEGESFDGKSAYALCRCGHSKSKLFCDGSHTKIGFDGRETASRVPYARQAETIEGPTLVLSDAENLWSATRLRGRPRTPLPRPRFRGSGGSCQNVDRSGEGVHGLMSTAVSGQKASFDYLVEFECHEDDKCRAAEWFWRRREMEPGIRLTEQLAGIVGEPGASDKSKEKLQRFNEQAEDDFQKLSVLAPTAVPFLQRAIRSTSMLPRLPSLLFG